MTFQKRVQKWMHACFGEAVSADKLERGDRYLEETFELLQSVGYPRDRIRALEDYVYSRPIGEPVQEAGGVMVTLAAFCEPHGIDMNVAGENELVSCWGKIEKIRAKQAAKPHGSALPIAGSPPPSSHVTGATSPASASPIRPVEARPEGQHQPDQDTIATSACPQTSCSPVAHETGTERELHAHEDFAAEQSLEPSEGKRRHHTTTTLPQQHAEGKSDV